LAPASPALLPRLAQGVPFAREYTQMRPSLRSDSLINVSFIGIGLLLEYSWDVFV
jgi:hypothetical protein